MKKPLPLKLKVVTVQERDIVSPFSLSDPHPSGLNQTVTREIKFLNKFKVNRAADKDPDPSESYQKIRQAPKHNLLQQVKNITGVTAESTNSGANLGDTPINHKDIQVSKFRPYDHSPYKVAQNWGDKDSVPETHFSTIRPRPPPLDLWTGKGSMRVESAKDESYEGSSPGRQEAYLFQLYARPDAAFDEGSNFQQDTSPKCSIDRQLFKGMSGTITSSEFARPPSPGLSRKKCPLNASQASGKKKSPEKKNRLVLRLKTVKEADEGHLCPDFKDDSYSSGPASESSFK